MERDEGSKGERDEERGRGRESFWGSSVSLVR